MCFLKYEERWQNTQLFMIVGALFDIRTEPAGRKFMPAARGSLQQFDNDCDAIFMFKM